MEHDKEETFVKVTDHYGYYYQSFEDYDGKFYIIYRINGRFLGEYALCYEVTAMRNKEDAIKECKYLEKLNFGGNENGLQFLQKDI